MAGRVFLMGTLSRNEISLPCLLIAYLEVTLLRAAHSSFPDRKLCCCWVLCQSQCLCSIEIVLLHIHEPAQACKLGTVSTRRTKRKPDSIAVCFKLHNGIAKMPNRLPSFKPTIALPHTVSPSQRGPRRTVPRR
uniref:Uncharacterized protein n=1 Tax=Cucumis melo TaxID=3656 RepID=A0A9I9E4H9_CUCME